MACFFPGSCNEFVSLSSLEIHKKSCNGVSSSVCGLPKPMVNQIREMLSDSKSVVIEIPTGGQVKLSSNPNSTFRITDIKSSREN